MQGVYLFLCLPIFFSQLPVFPFPVSISLLAVSPSRLQPLFYCIADANAMWKGSFLKKRLTCRAEQRRLGQAEPRPARTDTRPIHTGYARGPS